VEFNHRSTD